MSDQHPLDIITQDIPALEEWWRQYRGESVYDPELTRYHMSEFTSHVIHQARDGRILAFEKIARGIEADGDPKQCG